MEKILEFSVFAVPALVGIMVAYGLGHRSVRDLRTKTGDHSWLTYFLSGELFRPITRFFLERFL